MRIRNGHHNLRVCVLTMGEQREIINFFLPDKLETRTYKRTRPRKLVKAAFVHMRKERLYLVFRVHVF